MNAEKLNIIKNPNFAYVREGDKYYLPEKIIINDDIAESNTVQENESNENGQSNEILDDMLSFHSPQCDLEFLSPQFINTIWGNSKNYNKNYPQ